MFFRKIIIASSFFAASLAKVLDQIEDCAITPNSDYGFKVRFYPCPRAKSSDDANTGFNENFFSGGYKNFGPAFGEAKNVTDLNMYETLGESDTFGYLYGVYVPSINFTLEFTGFYKAPDTGLYNFNIHAMGGLSLQIGKGSSCCGDFSDEMLPPIALISSNNDLAHYSVFLEEGKYYPVKMVYYSTYTQHRIDIEITTGTGERTTRFDIDFLQGISIDCAAHPAKPIEPLFKPTPIVAVDPMHCGSTSDPSVHGFDVNFYEYPYTEGGIYDDSITGDYLKTDYKNFGPPWATARNVSDIFLDQMRYRSSGFGILYGVDVASLNFTTVYTGYFPSTVSGQYTFRISGSSGVGSQVGSQKDCCPLFNDRGFLQSVGGDVKTKSIQMKANTYYPIQIVFISAFWTPQLNVSVTYPNGITRTRFDMVIQSSSSNCLDS